MMRQRTWRSRRAIGILAVAMTGLVASGSTTASVVKAGDGGTIRMLEFYSQSNNVLNVEWLDMMSAIFEEENPGWSVEYESSTFDQIDQKAILDFEAGVSHDVLLSSPQLMAKHEAAGDLIDLTPYLEETYTPEQLADLNWSAGWQSATFGDQQLGIATGIHVRGNMVRNDIFEEAGLDPSVPLTTPEEVMEAGIAIKESGAADWGLAAFLGSNRATIEVTYAPLVWGYGGDFWENDAPAMTSEASVQAVEWLWDAVNESEIIPPFAAAADATYDAIVLETHSSTGTSASPLASGATGSRVSKRRASPRGASRRPRNVSPRASRRWSRRTPAERNSPMRGTCRFTPSARTRTWPGRSSR